jgi:hypothetical protein
LSPSAAAMISPSSWRLDARPTWPGTRTGRRAGTHPCARSPAAPRASPAPRCAAHACGRCSAHPAGPDRASCGSGSPDSACPCLRARPGPRRRAAGCRATPTGTTASWANLPAPCCTADGGRTSRSSHTAENRIDVTWSAYARSSLRGRVEF